MVMGSWSEKCLLGFGFIGIFTGISWDFVLFFSRKILGSNEMEWDLMLLFVGIE